MADVAMLAVFTAAYIVALDFPFRSARYPLVICCIGASLALANLLRDVFRIYRPSEDSSGVEQEESNGSHALKMSITLLLLIPCVGILGMLAGTALWLPLMLHFVAGMRWRTAVLDTALVVAFFFGVDHSGLGALPPGLLL